MERAGLGLVKKIEFPIDEPRGASGRDPLGFDFTKVSDGDKGCGWCGFNPQNSYPIGLDEAPDHVRGRRNRRSIRCLGEDRSVVGHKACPKRH